MQFIQRNFLALSVVVLTASVSFAQSNKPFTCLTHFGQKEWAILLKDADPERKQRVIDDAEFRKQQVANLRQMMAFSCAAIRSNLALDPINADELAYIWAESIALEYDKKMSAGKPILPFARVTDLQVANFYKTPANAAGFDRFFKVKIAVMTRDNPQFANQQLTEEETAQARALYARLRISERGAILQPEPFRSTAAFKARLQQTQFLARLYGAALAKKTAVSDSEVSAFIAAHPEFAVATKKAAAEKILQRAKAGENFATLANELSEDPGNNSSDGVKNGGLYSDVPVGMMVPAFEKASLSLNVGQIYPTVVESDFGYHVIKLENKTADGQKYDVRHILISTGVKDPSNPGGREVPVAMFVRTKLESEREGVEIDKVAAANPVVVEDYKPPVKAPVQTPVKTPVKTPAKKRVAKRKS